MAVQLCWVCVSLPSPSGSRVFPHSPLAHLLSARAWVRIPRPSNDQGSMLRPALEAEGWTGALCRTRLPHAHTFKRAHGAVVPPPLIMRKALCATPSVSIGWQVCRFWPRAVSECLLSARARVRFPWLSPRWWLNVPTRAECTMLPHRFLAHFLSTYDGSVFVRALKA